MENIVVRLTRITIKNFKNVVHGTLFLANPKKNYTASILGLYGQNGSGKTALIESISVLKYALCGGQIPDIYADYINVDADMAQLEYEFSIKNPAEKSSYEVIYSFSLGSAKNENYNSTGNPMQVQIQKKVIIFNETLKCSYRSNKEKHPLSKIIDTNTEDIFIPKAKLKELTKENDAIDLLVAKKMARSVSRSFVFSPELLNTIRLNCEMKYLRDLFESLVNFGNFELFIIDTKNTGLINIGALPLSFKYKHHGELSYGQIPIPLNGSQLIPQKSYKIVKNVIDSINIVLEQLIPHLTIDIKNIGSQLMPNSEKGTIIELTTKKNSKEIPLQYESEGIKKIISILQLLTVVYNNDSITVAIDELDSGIFEYLLGEILKIISEKGKGQLIFTSHNLRPLETIDRGFIAFTTTNPNNRYIRFTNVKNTNNLRDLYFRDIILAEQSEPVYDSTNNSEISLAFRKAGDVSVK